ncbi:Nucleolin [Grifola frondosa]|uniref:Nucleolin n=1 Tax=Grifola frondosa TaxID=5627 RepID=A0A1C7MMY6_GRIFR|nr:Nucleolin [Grifola frondosa]
MGESKQSASEVIGFWPSDIYLEVMEKLSLSRKDCTCYHSIFNSIFTTILTGQHLTIENLNDARKHIPCTDACCSLSFPQRQEETPPLDPTLPHLSEVQKEIERTKPRTLFIGNLPLRTTKEDVQRLFANYGDVFVRMRLTHRGACTGFVHVVFPSEDIAQQVLRETEVKPLMIALRDLPPSRTLFLGGLPPDAGASDVQELFSTATGMEVVRLASRHDGSCAGFAHIDFTSVAEAENVIQAHTSSPLKLGDHISQTGLR